MFNAIENKSSQIPLVAMSAVISWNIIFIEFILKCTFLSDSLKKDIKHQGLGAQRKKKDLSKRETI